MKKPEFVLIWDNVDFKMIQKRIRTLKEARTLVQDEYERQGLDYVFGQVVYQDNTRKDLFPKRGVK